MWIRQFYDATSSTYTYLLADPGTRAAVLIDTVYERHARDLALLRELDLELVAVLDTHVHADHVTGAWLMQQATGCSIALAADADAASVDHPLHHGDVITFGTRALHVRATPGHTAGCLSFVLDDQSCVFTGDCLLIRGAGRTDFQQGDAHAMYRSIREQLFTLPDTCQVWPAHDYDGRTCSTVGEERTHNARIGHNAREEDFVGYMNALGLPHPKLLDIALPANLRSGCPTNAEYPEAASWGPVTVSYAGVPEIDPRWVADHRAEVHVLDVRQPSELTQELGALNDVQCVPLETLRERLDEVPTGRPVITVCQTGARSAMAAVILARAGHSQVANVAGGMARWRALGLPS